MRNGFRILALGATAGLAAPTAFAHHGFGTFLMDEDVDITGVVTGFDYVNPHSWLYLDVTQDNGEVIAMRCEMRSATTLRRSGWSPDLFPTGKTVRITGNPDRNDPYSCYVGSVIFDDGSKLDRYGQITAPSEIGQAERPLRLANGEPNLSGDWAVQQVIMTDPRGQYGTLIRLEEALEVAATGDYTARGAMQGSRGTEVAAANAEAARAAREAAAGGEVAPAAGAAAPAAAGPGRAGGAAGGAGGARAGGAGGTGGRAGGGGRGGFGGGGNLLNEAGQAALAARPQGDRFAMSCVFTSIISEWGGEPVNRITQRGDTITIQYGRLGVERTVHMNLDAHPADVVPSLPGHSIGRWENDVLIVDTVGFAEGLFNARTPHSTALHVVEQFSVSPETKRLTRAYTADDTLYWTSTQTGTSDMEASAAPYDAEPCEDLTIDEDAELGPRD
jgi:hypothetical protein